MILYPVYTPNVVRYPVWGDNWLPSGYGYKYEIEIVANPWIIGLGKETRRRWIRKERIWYEGMARTFPNAKMVWKSTDRLAARKRIVADGQRTLTKSYGIWFVQPRALYDFEIPCATWCVDDKIVVIWKKDTDTNSNTLMRIVRKWFKHDPNRAKPVTKTFQRFLELGRVCDVWSCLWHVIVFGTFYRACSNKKLGHHLVKYF